MAKEVITELEVLFTANTDPVDKAAKQVKGEAERIERNPVEQKIDGDAKGALDAMDRVETEAKKIVSAKTMATVDANIEKAETSLSKVQDRLDYLHSIETDMEVTADIKKAEAALRQITRRRDGLVAARESMVVDADVAPAEAALDNLADDAADAGQEGGSDAGSNLKDGIITALASIPVAGAIIGVGSAIADALLEGFQDGLQVEVGRDRLQALTGLSETDAARIAAAAGEAYADTFGESIEANMDTARLALQLDLIDEDDTTRQAEGVISSLAGIADVLGEDVRPVAVAVTQMLRTGLVDSADQAFDVLATGAREGVNANEDLLDTFTEYPALFERLGLTGPEALGLINQALEGGARNSDLAADALKEFQIRATDASEASAEGFEALGLNAEEMTAKIAAGGEGARQGLAEVLTELGKMEPSAERTAAAYALFGTQAEDLGDALFNMDLSTAVEQLDGVTGAAQTMFDTLKDNDATELEEAKRNIEVAVQGIQGALAAAFSEPLGDFAEWVTQNRGPLLEFLLGLANGALEFGAAAVEGAATAAEGFGDFVAGPLADAVEGIANLLAGIDPIRGLLGSIVPGLELPATDLQELADSMRGFDESAEQAADDMRNSLLPGIQDAQDRLNDFGIPLVNQGYFHDASLRLADSIAQIGYAADGTTQLVDAFTVATDGSVHISSELEDQIRNAVDALNAEAEAGAIAGETQDSLTEGYKRGRQALIDQLVQMGIAEEDAIALADAYGAVPGNVETIFDAATGDAKDKAKTLRGEYNRTPKKITTTAAMSTRSAKTELDNFIRDNSGRHIPVKVDATPGRASNLEVSSSGRVRFNATGALLSPADMGLTPMSPVAQAVPPNTWRVIGDRMKDREFYIPDDGSSRSLAVLLEAMRSFGVLPMAGGGELSPTRAGRSTAGLPSTITLVDSSGALLGRMRVVAEDAIADEGRRFTYQGGQG